MLQFVYISKIERYAKEHYYITQKQLKDLLGLSCDYIKYAKMCTNLVYRPCAYLNGQKIFGYFYMFTQHEISEMDVDKNVRKMLLSNSKERPTIQNII